MAASRRDILTLSAAADICALATRAKATHAAPRTRDRRNPTLAGSRAYTTPATDVGDLPLFWNSFNDAPRRIQDGGWARQVTQADFQVSDSISGVNMRLDAGGVREMHWHQAAEWAFMSYGNCRVTNNIPDVCRSERRND